MYNIFHLSSCQIHVESDIDEFFSIIDLLSLMPQINHNFLINPFSPDMHISPTIHYNAGHSSMHINIGADESFLPSGHRSAATRGRVLHIASMLTVLEWRVVSLEHVLLL